MAFNPKEHLMQLKGKDYLQVAWRLVWFRQDHPDWAIDASILEMDADHAIFKAVICDENGVQKCSGHGSESKRDFGDFLEKAETKAIGRALAMLGYGTQFTGDELDEGERIVDSPVTLGSAEKAQEIGKKKLEQMNAEAAVQKAKAENQQEPRRADGQADFILQNASKGNVTKLQGMYGEHLENMSYAKAREIIEYLQTKKVQ